MRIQFSESEVKFISARYLIERRRRRGKDGTSFERALATPAASPTFLLFAPFAQRAHLDGFGDHVRDRACSEANLAPHEAEAGAILAQRILGPFILHTH